MPTRSESILEYEWKKFLAGRGIPVPASVFVPSGVATARAETFAMLRPPLVVKAMSPTIVHKSDVGAVQLGVPDAAAVPVAIAEMAERLEARGLGTTTGFLVEEMAEGGLEVIVGVLDDPTFGRLLAFGLGGLGVEALGEVKFFALPLRPFDLDTLLEVAWLGKALHRTGDASARALRDLLWRVGGPEGLGLDPQVRHFELNPVIVSRSGVVAVDARGEQTC